MLNPVVVIAALGTAVIAIYHMSLDDRGPKCFWWWGWGLVAVISFYSAIKWSVTPR